MKDKQTFYITTPIYYPSDKLHIGHSYTTVAADAMARYKRFKGYDVMFLTGTDEHGQKIETIANENNMSPKAYVDKIVAGIKELWELLDISYDQFIRTTDANHQEIVQKIFKKLYDKGDIYKSEYEGWYCTPCESFWTELQLEDGKCPDCHRDVELVKEESYFFKMSKYQDRLIKHIEENDDFIKPNSRKNEMLNNFLRPGLEDLCVSRTSFKWGVPVTFDEGHVVYVWIDALSNYITALGYMTDNEEKFKRYWPADVHLVGKEIVRFHTIIWPIMLMALDIELPKQIFGHGWLILEGGKMSKSKGNVVDPLILEERYGLDALRYFLLREVPFGSDGVFSNEALINRINSDLANDLGNLLSRTVAMIDRYFDGEIKAQGPLEGVDGELIELALATPKKVEDLMDELLFSNALSEIWKLVSRANKYIDETMPWVLAKSPEKAERLGSVLYNLAEALRFISVLISPFMTRTPKLIREQLGMKEDMQLINWESLDDFGLIEEGIRVKKGDIIFPRLDLDKELEELDKLFDREKASKDLEKPKDTKQEKNEEELGLVDSSEITIDDFAKIELKLAKVKSAEPVKKADRLLKLQLDIKGEDRQVVAGIAKHYKPEELVGKTIVIVYNLKPVKLRGELSQGMILAASDDEGNLSLLTVDRDMPSGSTVS